MRLSSGLGGQASPRLGRSRSRRRAWLQVHRWLGLILGAWLALIGLTGSVLAFYHELEELVHPATFAVTPREGGEAAFRPLAEVLAALDAELPPGVRPSSMYYPRTDGSAWWGRYTVPDGSAQAGLWYVFVDPYTARVLGRWKVKESDEWFRREFSGFLYDLHYKLLLPGHIGEPVVGVICLLAFVSLAIGIYLWWPKNGSWRRALTFKRRASAQRVIFDLHNLSGLYLLPVLVAVLLSGLYFNLRDQFMWVVRQFSPATVDLRSVNSRATPSAQAIGLARAFEIARARFPEGRPELLGNAPSPEAAYSVCSKNAKSVSRFADRRCVQIDQYSGEILWFTASGQHTGGDTFIAWQLPLHSGKAFGLPGRLLVLASGLLLPVLFTTGVIRWTQKRRSRRAEVRRHLLRASCSTDSNGLCPNGESRSAHHALGTPERTLPTPLDMTNGDVR